MTLAELRAKRANIVAQARAKYDEITPDTPEGRAAEIEGEFDRMMKEAASLEERAARLERLEGAEASLEAGDPRRPGGDGEERGAAPEGAQPMEYRDAFHALLQAGGDVHAMAPEARAALAAQRPDLSAEQRAQIAGTATAGGHLVPDEMMQGIVTAMADWGPMWDDNFCTVISTTGGGTIPIPTNDDLGNEAELNTAEGQPLTDDGGKDTTFGREALEDFMIDTEWLRISIQLATGSFMGIQTFLEQRLGERLGRKANALLTTGTGSSQPHGIVAASGVGKTAAAQAAFTADEVIDFVHSVNAAYRRSPKARMMFSDGTLLMLSKLKDGQGNYLLQTAPDGSGVLQIGAKRIPYAINDDVPAVAAGNTPMVYGDFSRYFVRKIGGVVIGTDRSSAFWPGFGLAGYTRLDGVLTDPRAIKKFQMAAA